MARKAGAGGAAGEVVVRVVADTSQTEEQIKAMGGTPVKVPIEPELKPGQKIAATGAKPKVDVDLKIDEKTLRASVQAVFNKSFDLIINTTKLRTDIQTALNQAFELKVNAVAGSMGGGPGNAGVSAAMSAERTIVAPMRQFSRDLIKAFNAAGGVNGPLATTINDLYDTIHSGSAARGMPIGTISPTHGDAADVLGKLSDLFDSLGDDLGGWVDKLARVLPPEDLDEIKRTGRTRQGRTGMPAVLGEHGFAFLPAFRSERGSRPATITVDNQSTQNLAAAVAKAQSEAKPPPSVRTTRNAQAVAELRAALNAPDDPSRGPLSRKDVGQGLIDMLRARVENVPEETIPAQVPGRRRGHGRFPNRREIKRLSDEWVTLQADLQTLDEGLGLARGDTGGTPALSERSGVVRLSEEQRKARSAITERMGIIERSFDFMEYAEEAARRAGRTGSGKPLVDPSRPPKKSDFLSLDVQSLLNLGYSAERTKKGVTQRFGPMFYEPGSELERRLAHTQTGRPANVGGYQVRKLSAADVAQIGNMLITGAGITEEDVQAVRQRLSAAPLPETIAPPRGGRAGRGGRIAVRGGQGAAQRSLEEGLAEQARQPLWMSRIISDVGRLNRIMGRADVEATKEGPTERQQINDERLAQELGKLGDVETLVSGAQGLTEGTVRGYIRKQLGTRTELGEFFGERAGSKPESSERSLQGLLRSAIYQVIDPALGRTAMPRTAPSGTSPTSRRSYPGGWDTAETPREQDIRAREQLGVGGAATAPMSDVASERARKAVAGQREAVRPSTTADVAIQELGSLAAKATAQVDKNIEEASLRLKKAEGVSEQGPAEARLNELKAQRKALMEPFDVGTAYFRDIQNKAKKAISEGFELGSLSPSIQQEVQEQLGDRPAALSDEEMARRRSGQTTTGRVPGTEGIRGLGRRRGREVPVGDQVRDTASRFGIVPGIGESGGAGGGGRITRAGAGGEGGFEVTGQIHVIVDNTPLPITWANGEGPGGGGGGGSGTPGQQAIGQRRAASARYGAYTSEKALESARKKAEDLEKRGYTQEQIAASMKAGGLGPQAALLFDPSGGMGSRNARRQKLGLDPIIGDITGPAAQAADTKRAELAAEANAANRRILRRSLTPSLTDIFQAPFFSKQVEAVNRFNRESGQLGTMLSQQAKATLLVAASEEEYAAAKEKGSKTGIARAEKELSKDRANLATITKQVAAQEDLVGEARAGLPSPSQAAANIAIGGVAAGGAFAIGSVIFQVAGQALQLVEKGLSEVMKPVIERLSGFSATVGRTQEALAKGIAATYDDVDATLASAAAQSRLSQSALDLISGPLGDRGRVVAGTQQLAARTDLVRTGTAAGEQQIEGFDRALVRPTGGVFDWRAPGAPSGIEDFSIGGQASFAETLRGRLTDLPTPEGYSSNTDNFISQWVGKTFGGFEDGLEEATKKLNVLNKEYEKTAVTFSRTDNQAALEAQAKAFKEAGAKSLGETLLQRRVLVENRGEGVADMKAALTALDELARVPVDLDTAIRNQQRAVTAQEESRIRQLELRQQKYTPGTIGVQRAMAPMGDITAPLKAMGVSGLGEIEDLLKQVTQQTAQYQQTARTFVSDMFKGTTAGAEFAAAMDDASSYAKQISDLQIGIQTSQAAYAAKQYDFSLFQAKRSLADAKALAGDLTGASKDNLGYIERQTWELQRQSQLLGFELTQRGINFKKALAGFIVPGLTPEEQAARVEQAKIEADYAQKQLDIQKKLFGLSGQGFKITASRAVIDLGRQVGLLTEGREVTLKTAKAEAKIATLVKLMDEPRATVEMFWQEAINKSQDIEKRITDLATATGEALADVANAVLKQFNIVITGLNQSLKQGIPDKYGPQQPGGKAFGAEGLLFNTTGRTTLTVGEAGTETVAVLSNPRQMAMPSPFMTSGNGGQQIVFNINISGDSSVNEETLKTWSKQIVKDIDRHLGRTASLIGMRNEAFYNQ